MFICPFLPPCSRSLRIRCNLSCCLLFASALAENRCEPRAYLVTVHLSTVGKSPISSGLEQSSKEKKRTEEESLLAKADLLSGYWVICSHPSLCLGDLS
ncbi:hypothetical protein L596_005589 [Steinernema carpocapsae]|uniref:Secreted protein n=1 Tax=Steinernema carpocapsae TaxID=34508 RepID=A0A4U8UZK1_STECR|nr:hypothetical protein L596_005589 [Steinernema carpocapsae]